MEKINDFVVSSGDDFYGVFDAADDNNESIDSVISRYLDNNSDGISFSYDGKNYLLSKDSKTGKYVLHREQNGEMVLKDPEVQIDSKFTPDGFVELGGLTPVGTRLFIGRSPVDAEQVIAFVSPHGIDRVLNKPENAVVLFDGNAKPQEESDLQVEPDNKVGSAGDAVSEDDDIPLNDVPPVDSQEADSKTPNKVTSPYAFPRELPDGLYEVKDGKWHDASGMALKLSVFPPGIYQVMDGEASRQFVTDGGSTLFIPVNQYSAQYLLGASIKDSNGQQLTASFEFLTQNGVKADEIHMPFINLRSSSSSVNGAFTVELRENTKVLVNSEGSVVGLPLSLEPGNYFSTEISGQRVIYREVMSSGREPVFLPVNTYSGLYEANGQPILDQNKVPLKQNGSPLQSTFEQLTNNFGIAADDIALKYFTSTVAQTDKYRVVERQGLMLVIDILTETVVGRVL